MLAEQTEVAPALYAAAHAGGNAYNVRCESRIISVKIAFKLFSAPAVLICAARRVIVPAVFPPSTAGRGFFADSRGTLPEVPGRRLEEGILFT